MKQDQFSRWNSTKVKARAGYTCQKCGSMENIQAHDPSRTHSDWRSGVALCGDCHSKEHPDIARGLFTISGHQPYWPNISARSLAQELSCHNRTIIRWAAKLRIPFGQPLSPENKERLRISILRIETTKTAAKMICIHKCKRCGHEWATKNPRPLRCASCKTPYWDRERKSELGKITSQSHDPVV